ncbi:MAG: hypothetical protein EOO77_23945 [Oxalobacteraceae bacterium]|nr:MAG: hypothetical protein EOO77_23945 [Oxalobacteraceae bacterium]
MHPSESLIYVAEHPWSNKERKAIKFDVCNHKDVMRVDWTCSIMEVYEHERCLDGGRFINFVRETQPNVVNLRLENHLAPWRRVIPERVNWIADHVQTPWSMTLTVHDVQSATYHFSFADVGIAMMFKLVFG